MTGPVVCPACGQPFIVMSARPAETGDSRGSHVYVYTHADGTKHDEPPRQRRIVVIEDEPSLRDVTVMALVDEGYKVASAGDADEGLRVISEEWTHLVVIDQGVGAAGVVEQLEQLPSSTRPAVIVISGGPPQLPEAACVRGWLAKPFATAQLAEACARALGVARRKTI